MKYTFYGTAAAEGIPGIFCECETCKRARKLGGRNIMTRSQSVIDDVLGIDFSADTYMHDLIYGMPVNNIQTYVITHNHMDHFYLEDIRMRANGFSNPMGKVLDIYIAKDGFDSAIKRLGTEGRFREYVNINLIEPFKPFTTKEGYRVTPLKADHTNDPLIFIIEKDGKRVLHSNDTGYYPEETWKYLEENKVHIDFAEFDCTCENLTPEMTKCDNHMNYSTVKNVKKHLTDMGLIDDTTICVINHFSHNGGMIYEDLKALGEKDGFLCSYDGMSVDF